jgi:hypothetical protein
MREGTFVDRVNIEASFVPTSILVSLSKVAKNSGYFWQEALDTKNIVV